MLKRFLPRAFMTYLFFIVISTPLTTFLGKQTNSFILFNGLEELVLFGLGLIGLVYAFMNPTIKRLFYNPVFSLACAFTVFATILLMFQGRDLGSIAGFIVNVRFVVILFLGVIVGSLNSKYTNKLFRSVVYFGIIGVILGLLMSFMPNNTLSSIGYDAAGSDTIGAPAASYYVSDNLPIKRLNGSFRSPNSLGVYLLIPLTIVIFYRPLDIRKQYRCAIGITLIAGILLTFSRSAWLGLVALSGFYFFQKMNLKDIKKHLLVAAAIIAGLGLAFSALSQTHFGSNLLLHQNKDQSNGATNKRVEIYKENFTRILHEPIGKGSGYTNYGGRIGQESSYIGSTENSYLQVGLELGWIGIALFVSLLYYTHKACKSFPKKHRLVFISLLSCILMVGLFIPIWTDEVVSLTWWGLFGVALGSKIKSTEQSISKLKSSKL